MTENDWLLDVLVDLQAFATANGLGAVAEHLGETLKVAQAEISSQEEKTGAQTDGEQSQVGSNFRVVGGDQHS